MLSPLVIRPDAGRDARALALVASVPTWPRYTLKVAVGAFEAGTVFRRAVGSGGARYLVNSVACECPDYQRNGAICKHIRAHVIWEQQQEAATVAASPSRPSYEDLWPACKGGCGDLADTRDGYCDRCASERERQQRRSDRSRALAA